VFEGAEGIAGDPEAPGVRVDRLHPVERGGGVADLADAAVVAALAAADPAEVEAHHREAQLLEALVHRVGDAVVHRSAMQRMRVQDQRQRGALLLGVVVATFEPAIRPGEHDFRHDPSKFPCSRPAR